MKQQFKNVLGIDISFDQINLALLRKSKNGLKLLKVAGCPVPDGAIKAGNIEDATALAKAIKHLKVKNKIRTNHVALSMVMDPTIMQTMDIPNNAWDDVGQFVRNEIKHCAALSMTKIASDYCGIKSTDKTDKRRAFVVAADSQKITAFVDALNKEGLDVNAVEPFSVAYIRACYAKKIAEKFDQNLVFVILRDNILTLCVFKNQILDFVENEKFEVDRFSCEESFRLIIEKINALLKFYRLKLADECDNWEVDLCVSISDESIKEKMGSLSAKLKTDDLPYSFLQNSSPVEFEFKSLDQAYLDTPVADTKLADKPSAIAVGLAMKLLNVEDCGLNTNLLLPEMVNSKPERKHALIIANIAAAIFLLAVLVIGFLDMQVRNIKESVKEKHGKLLSSEVKSMLNNKDSLDEQIVNTTENFENMSAILNTAFFARWDKVLDEIRYATPKPVRIVNIFSNDGLKIMLKGHALSYESIHLFVRMLNKSEYMKLVSLIGTEKDTESSGLVAYSVSCSLVE